MKLIIFFLVGFSLHISATGFAQQVTLSARNAKLETVFKQIREQTGYTFVYRNEWMENARNVDLNLVAVPITQALDLCFKEQPFTYSITRTTVIVRQKESRPLTLTQANFTVRGRVVNEKNEPIPGASIAIRGEKKGVTTSEDGSFVIPVKEENVILRVTSLGYADQEVRASAKEVLTIRMKAGDKKLGEVIVTGMMTRNKETFTGATATFNTQQLKTVSNVNIVQSLRALDPSFLVMENNGKGSNPNVLPTLELRGKTSISTDALRDEFSTDPNQPLFILDGFETTLRQVVDLDMNRVASVTILKDAASTAIYGSRASNGVIVIETIRPKAGELNFSYTNDMTMELPDLSSYNRMNAREKLQFELLSGRYKYNPNVEDPESQYLYYTPLYSKRMEDVERGVDSYWLSDPLQTGFSQRHSLYVGGGSGAVVFEAGGNYRKLTGVMIGSGREDWGTRLNLAYRRGKVSVNNMTFINGYKSNESPYGSFADWVNVNPYYEKLPASEKNLEEFYDREGKKSELVPNPLYNASLNSFSTVKNYELINNLQLNYDVAPALRFQASLQLLKGSTSQADFISPLNTTFDKKAIELKGTYKSAELKNFSYTANAMLTYYKVFGAHLVNANLRTEIQETNNSLLGFTATGFPAGSNGNPRFAYGYALGGVPAASSNVFRRNSVISSLNYSYDRRYNVDASFTYDGSTAFGRSNLYSPFYSIGGSWNLNREAFLERVKWVDLLRLRANIGLTGNQNFNATTSVSTYNYFQQNNIFGQGVLLGSLGNPGLDWQNTLQTSAGLDAGLFNNRLTLQLNIYKKVTDPLVVAITLPSSTGLSNYPFNAGNLTVKGGEFTLRYAPVYKPAQRIVWTIGVTGSAYTQVYDKFDQKLTGINEKLRQSNSLTRYRDGYSSDDIWAVPSLGIDPATGREIFRKKDGAYTFDFNYNDQVVVGSARPRLQGVISNSFSYKGFFLNLNMRYLTGQDIFNTALYNRVENISFSSLIKNNQDKRALYDRWKKPGDVAEFKGISLTDYSPMSSRFVQRENTLTLESANIGYEFRSSVWLKKARLSNLRLSGFTNEIFRISTVKRERGIEYPYARSFSFSLTANFQ